MLIFLSKTMEILKMSHKIEIILLIFFLISLSFEQEIGLVAVDTINLAEVIGIDGSYSNQRTYSLGDLDGDGYSDFITSGYIESDSGWTLFNIIFYGDSDFSFSRIKYMPYAPYVVNVGDVNGDGWNDLLMGHPNMGMFSYGEVWLFLGGSDMDTIEDWSYSPYIYYNFFGSRIIPVGDDNEDGFDDFIVVGPSGDFDCSGEICLFYGSADVPHLERMWEGETDTSFLGWMTYLGDFNGDSLKDILTQTGGFSGGHAQYWILLNTGRIADGEFIQVGEGQMCSTSYGIDDGYTDPRGIPYSFDFDEDGKDEIIIDALSTYNRYLFEYNDDSLDISIFHIEGLFIQNPFKCFICRVSDYIVFLSLGEDEIDTIYIDTTIYHFSFGDFDGYGEDINNDGYDDLIYSIIDSACSPLKFIIFTTNPHYNAIFEGQESVHPPQLYIYPNPSNSGCFIKFSANRFEAINVSLIDLSGRQIATLFSGRAENNAYSISLNTNNLSTGVYFIRLTTPNKTLYKKLLIVK